MLIARHHLQLVLLATLAGSIPVPGVARAQVMMRPRQFAPTPVLRFTPQPTPAQTFVNPYANGFLLNPYSTGLLGTNPYLSINPGYGLSGAGYPYGSYAANSYGTNPYGGYGQYPMGAYMQGTGAYGNSESRLLIDNQQANLLKEQAEAKKIENRKKAVDNWLWYRDHVPTAEDDRQKALAKQLRRSLHDPSPADILSGQALNLILADLGSKLGKNPPTADLGTSLDPEILPHLNIIGKEGDGNPGLFKNEGRLMWPHVMTQEHFKTDRDTINNVASALYEQALAGSVDTGTLQKMQQTIEKLHSQLSAQIKELTPAQYGEAKRFLRHFEDALKLLRRPDAAEFLTPLRVKGKTIEELVGHMLQKGWRFAPALPGDETAYWAVYRAMVSYHRVGVRDRAAGASEDRANNEYRKTNKGYRHLTPDR